MTDVFQCGFQRSSQQGIAMFHAVGFLAQCAGTVQNMLTAQPLVPGCS